jgi:hypothetical protein
MPADQSVRRTVVARIADVVGDDERADDEVAGLSRARRSAEALGLPAG